MNKRKRKKHAKRLAIQRVRRHEAMKALAESIGDYIQWRMSRPSVARRWFPATQVSP